jgi:hypothetical protein
MDASGWLRTVASELGVAEVVHQDDLLDLTREIAHGLERQLGPLTLFLLGQAVAAGGNQHELTTRIRALL